MNTHPVRRCLGALAASTLLVVTLAGCGSDDTDPFSSDPGNPDAGKPDAGRVLDEDTLREALIDAEDLPDGYTLTPDDDGSGGSGGGSDDSDAQTGTCLDDLSGFDARDTDRPGAEATVDFTATTAQGQNSISASAESYRDAAAAAAALDAFLAFAKGCPRARGTADGVTYDLRLSANDRVTLDAADHQVNVLVEGTISAGDRRFTTTFGFVVATTGNDLAGISASDIGEVEVEDSANDQLADLAQTQLNRVSGLD